MKTKTKSFAAIKKDIVRHKKLLNQVHLARQAVRGYNAVPVEERGALAAPLRAMLAAKPAKRTFTLLSQGDSWFDYAPGTDLIDCLHSNHGHKIISNLAVAGSTLNDEAYGPVPSAFFGLPFAPKQSDDPDRITELVHRIQQDKPQALLLSAGGNDIAGDEFFSVINNSKSGLPPVNQQVLDGIVNGTFKTAYQYLIDTALKAASDAGIGRMPIFTHGYDYPWPDGRGVISFLGWKIGPWFDETFKLKNYPNTNNAELKVRRDIIVKFIDSLNAMLDGLASKQYPGKLFHVNLVGTLKTRDDWANELHPGNDGFSALAKKIDASLQANI